MSTTPYQTYLEERLQSARRLGWEVTVGGAAAPPHSGRCSMRFAYRLTASYVSGSVSPAE